MTDKKLDQTISDWLEAERPGQLPDRVLRATFERTRKAKQQGGWRALLGRLSMPEFAAALAGAAIVLVAGVVALGVYFNGPGIGVKPTPTPSASPSPSPAPTPSASTCVEFPGGGTYTAPVASLSLTVAVPDAASNVWQGNTKSFEMLRAACSDGSGYGSFHAGQVTTVYQDACHRAAGRAVDSVAAAVAALADVPGVEVGPPTDINIAGYSGSQFELVGQLSFDLAGCEEGGLQPLNGVPPMGTDNTFTVSLIDVDGSLLAITIPEYASQPRDVAAELAAMVDSMQIERTD